MVARMLLELLGLETTPFNQFISLAVGGVGFYFLISGLSYLIFFVWGKKRFHPDYAENKEELRHQMKWGVIGVIGNAALMLPLTYMMATGHSQAYFDVSERGWPYLIGSIVVYVAFTETCIYWTHRWLHTDFGYKHLHHIHHEWRTTTSWVSMAFHPVDSFLQALPHHLMIFLIPLHGSIYFVMLTFVSIWSVIIHDRVSIVRWGAINYTGHHTLHHWYYTCNYGQFFTFWDRLMGTHMDPAKEEKNPEVPEGLLR
jgi:lathosterol oxidase